MIPIRQFLPAVIAAAVRPAPLTPEKVAFAWRSAVGPAIANAATVELDGATLVVHARGAAWRREVEHAAGTIRRRMSAVLGDGVVKTIDVRLD